LNQERNTTKKAKKKMQRRKFLSAAGVAIGATASSQVLGAFGGLDKVGGALGGAGAGVGGALGMGGAGGASWKDVAKQFGEAKALFATTAQQQAMISADIAEALDLKSAADVLRGEANNLAEKGDSMGSSDLNAVAENSASTQALIEAKLQESESLSDEQKAALAQSASEYLPTLITGFAVAKSVKDAVQLASGLGVPGFRDGRAAISAAKDIPVLGPKMIKFFVDSGKTGKSLMGLMQTKGVATPDESEMDSQLAGFA
jgi:hypothetical protein